MPDDDGYPTDAELAELAALDAIGKDGFNTIMARVRELWWGGKKFVREIEPGIWFVSTVGWSGNESIITTLRTAPSMFWTFYWRQSRRGGHFVFAAHDADDDAIDRVCCFCDVCPTRRNP